MFGLPSKSNDTKKKKRMTHRTHENLNSISSIIQGNTTQRLANGNIYSKMDLKPHRKWCAMQTIAWKVVCVFIRTTWDNAKYEYHLYYAMRLYIFAFGWCFFFFISCSFFTFHAGFGCFHFSIHSFSPSHLNSTITFYLAFGSIVSSDFRPCIPKKMYEKT